MPGSTSDFHTQDFIPPPLDSTALAVRQARGIHSIQPFLEIFLPCRFFKAFGKQNCWRLIDIRNQTNQEEEVPTWVRRIQLSRKHPHSAGLRLWGVPVLGKQHKARSYLRATVGWGLGRGDTNRDPFCISFVRPVW